jgi:hypothetical protein
MGTKNNPNPNDCYAKAEPDEPMFVLLARDQHAPQLVELWAARRASEGEDPAKVEEALKCAKTMRKYRYERKGAPMCEYCAEDDVENDEFCEKVAKHIVNHNGFQHWHWCGNEEAVIYDGTVVQTIEEYFSTDEVSNEYCNDEGLRAYHETKAMRARANAAVTGEDEPEGAEKA